MVFVCRNLDLGQTIWLNASRKLLSYHKWFFVDWDKLPRRVTAEFQHHSHTHPDATVNSGYAQDDHEQWTFGLVTKNCGYDANPPTHYHSITISTGDDSHRHSVTVSFASANLGSPNWWEHVHALTHSPSASGGAAHTHTLTSPASSRKCSRAVCTTNHNHTFSYNITTGSSGAHTHTFSGNSANSSSGQTPASHSHAFSLTTGLAGDHLHAQTVTSSNAGTCAGGKSHSHFLQSDTGTAGPHSHTASGTSGLGGESAGTAHYLTCTEIIGFSDSKTRTKTVHRTLTEKLGALDTKTRIKTVHRTLTEKLGALDSKSRAKSVHRALMEYLGASDSKARTKTISRTASESLGAKDSKTRQKSIFRTITEAFGALDARTRVKSIFRTVTEKLGASDSFGKTKGVVSTIKQWGYALPARLMRRFGISGISVKTSKRYFGLKASLLAKKKVSMEASGKTVSPVQVRSKINITHLGRKQKLSIGASTVIPLKVQAKANGHLLRAQKSGILVEGKQRFDLVAEALGLLEAHYTFMFVAVTDDKTCDVCMRFDGLIFDGADIERMFPYATQVDYSLWMANLHPHCRCFLVLLEIGP